MIRRLSVAVLVIGLGSVIAAQQPQGPPAAQTITVWAPEPLPSRDVIAKLPGFRADAADVVDDVPHIRVGDSGLAVEASHHLIRSDAVSNVHENFAVRRSVIPFTVGQV